MHCRRVFWRAFARRNFSGASLIQVPIPRVFDIARRHHPTVGRRSAEAKPGPRTERDPPGGVLKSETKGADAGWTDLRKGLVHLRPTRELIEADRLGGGEPGPALPARECLGPADGRAAGTCSAANSRRWCG